VGSGIKVPWGKPENISQKKKKKKSGSQRKRREKLPKKYPKYGVLVRLVSNKITGQEGKGGDAAEVAGLRGQSRGIIRAQGKSKQQEKFKE